MVGGVMVNNREESKMSTLENQLQSNLKNIKKIAQANTVKNKEGLTVISKDDPIREELDWETTIHSVEDKE